MMNLKSLFLSNYGFIPYITGFIIVYAIIVYIYDSFAFGIRKNKWTRKKEALIKCIDINVDIAKKGCSALKHFEFRPEVLADYSEVVLQTLTLYMADLVDIMLLCKYDTEHEMKLADEYKFLKIINNFLCADSLIFEDSCKMRNSFLDKIPDFNDVFLDSIKNDNYEIYDSIFTDIFDKGFSRCTDSSTDDFYKANKILRNMQDYLNQLCGIYNIDIKSRFRFSKYYMDLTRTGYRDFVLQNLKTIDNDLMSGNILIKSTEELLDAIKSTDNNIYSYHELKKISDDMKKVLYVLEAPADFVQAVFGYIDKLSNTSMTAAIVMGLYHMHDINKFSHIIPDNINDHDLNTLLKDKEREVDLKVCMSNYRKIMEYLIDFTITHDEMKNMRKIKNETNY